MKLYRKKRRDEKTFHLKFGFQIEMHTCLFEAFWR